MQLCDSGHEEVAFEGRQYPVCEMESDKNDEIESLKDEIRALEEKISELEDRGC